MESIVVALGRACLHAGLLALLVWLIIRLWRTAPSFVQRWGWWLVCAKSLVVLTGAFWFNLPLLPVEQHTIFAEPPNHQHSASSVSAGLQPSDMPIASSNSTISISITPSMNLSWHTLVVVLWGIGVLVFASVLVGRWWKVRRLCAQSEPIDDPYWHTRLHALSVDMELPDVPRVRLSPEMHAPMVVGGWRAWVLIPRALWERLTDEEREMVLVHEFAHIRRGDGWWGLVPLLAQVLLFFFPPIRYAGRHWELSCEMESDQAVLSHSRYTPYAYGNLLMKVATFTQPMPTPVILGMSHNFAYLRTRLKRMAQRNRASLPLTLGVMAILVLASLPWRLIAQQSPSLNTAEWQNKLHALQQADWGSAYEVGIELASLPPDEGYALIQAHFYQLPTHARQQILKALYFTRPYPLRPRMHPYLVRVLELGVRDPSPSVRSWAKSYLHGITLQEFESQEALDAWFERYRHLPLQRVVHDHWEPFLRTLPELRQEEQEQRLLALAKEFAWLREPTVVRPLAMRYRLPDLLQQTIHTHKNNPDMAEVVKGLIECVSALQLEEFSAHAILAPLLDPQQPCLPAVRAMAIRISASPRYRSAIGELLTLAHHALEQPVEPELWGALAEAFQYCGDTRALPILKQMATRAEAPHLQKAIAEAIAELEGK